MDVLGRSWRATREQRSDEHVPPGHDARRSRGDRGPPRLGAGRGRDRRFRVPAATGRPARPDGSGTAEIREGRSGTGRRGRGRTPRRAAARRRDPLPRGDRGDRFPGPLPCRKQGPSWPIMLRRGWMRHADRLLARKRSPTWLPPPRSGPRRSCWTNREGRSAGRSSGSWSMRNIRSRPAIDGLDALIRRGAVGTRSDRRLEGGDRRPAQCRQEPVVQRPGRFRSRRSSIAAPGVTRDVVSFRTAFAGWPVELCDTAGERETDDAVEQTRDRPVPPREAGRRPRPAGPRSIGAAPSGGPRCCWRSAPRPSRWPTRCDLPPAWDAADSDILGGKVLAVSAETGEGLRGPRRCHRPPSRRRTRPRRKPPFPSGRSTCGSLEAARACLLRSDLDGLLRRLEELLGVPSLRGSSVPHTPLASVDLEFARFRSYKRGDAFPGYHRREMTEQRAEARLGRLARSRIVNQPAGTINRAEALIECGWKQPCPQLHRLTRCRRRPSRKSRSRNRRLRSPTASPLTNMSRMTQTGILTEDDRVELINGIVVTKMAKGPAHIWAAKQAEKRLEPLLGGAFSLRREAPARIPTLNEPEPDLVIARGRDSIYLAASSGIERNRNGHRGVRHDVPL